MAKSPILSKYPHLHQLLRNDPVANAEFQKCLGEARSPTSNIASLEQRLETSETNLAAALVENERLKKKQGKIERFISLLGSIIEPQTPLQPYVQDVSEKRTYEISFSADQIRLALKLYWDVVARGMEDLIRGTDPAKDRENSEDTEP